MRRRQLTHIAARAAWSAALLLALSFALFGALSAMPGQALDLLVLSDPSVSPDDVARLAILRGLDQPWPLQWLRWLVGHREPLAPPHVTAPTPQLAELSEGGVVVVGTRSYRVAGVYDEPFVAAAQAPRGGDPGVVEAVGIGIVRVAPHLSPLAPAHPPELDEGERQLAGGEPTLSERVSEAELVAAADAAGRALDVAPVHVEQARAGVHGFDIDIDERSLFAHPERAHPGLSLEVIAGPGRIDGGRYRAHFDSAGRSAVIFRVTDEGSFGGPSARGAFVVEHGAVPDPERYHRGALCALLGDGAALGFSWTEKRPVAELLRGRVANTLALSLPALALALAMALILGTAAAGARRRGALDRLVTSLSTLAIAVPPYWLGLILVAIFAVHLHALPAGGTAAPGSPLSSSLAHAILPVLVLAIAWAGPLIRYVRAGVVDALVQDYARTARAKGLGERAVLIGHALRNALLPLITALGLLLPQLFAGALLTETVFAWPGVGRLQVDAITSGDSYVAVVVALLEAALVLAGNWLADAAVTLVDPRLREPRA